MKKLILLTLACLPALVFAQTKKYIVEGTIGKYNAPAKIYLQYRANGKTNTDSTVMTNGEFQFLGSLTTVSLNAYLIFNKKGTGPAYNDYKAVYLEPGIIKVTGDSTLATSKVTGTKTNEDNNRYNAAMKPVNDAYAALETKNKAVPDDQQKTDAFQKENSKAEKAIEAQEAAASKQFIATNPDSYVSLNALESYAYGADYVDIAPLYYGLTPAVRQTDAGKKFGERMPLLKNVALGATAPEFTEADTIGTMVALSSFRGKYVLIDFWASWCGPCRQENPNVVKAFKRYKTQKFTIVGVSLDRPGAKDKWLKAIHADGLAWTQLSDLKFWDSKAAGLYAVRGIPQNFLLDPNGKIIGKNLRGDALEEKLAAIFGKVDQPEAGKSK